jgi:hypothetical protein
MADIVIGKIWILRELLGFLNWDLGIIRSAELGTEI